MKPTQDQSSELNGGWVKAFRSLLDWAWFKNPAVAHLWQYCLLKATYRPHKAPAGGRIITLLPGQFIFGRKVAASETGLSEKEVRNALLKLIESECVKKGHDKGQAFTIITICNWERYQSEANNRGQDGAGCPQPKNTKNPNEVDGNSKNISTKRICPKRGQALGQADATITVDDRVASDAGEYSRGQDKGQAGAKQGPSRGQAGATDKKDKNGKKEKKLSAALGSPPVENGESKAIVSPSVDLAVTWYELLKLEHTKQSEEKDQADFEDLLSVTYDIDAGKLPPSARETLTTLAHQIGSRDPMPNSPLGMFLAEVGKMRLRASRAPKGPG